MKHKKVLCVIGLRTATEQDISELISHYKNRGYITYHKVHNSVGQKLPYNGVLQVKRK